MTTPLIAEIEGYAARFGEIDLNGDVIEPGAFKKTLAARTAPVRMLYQHGTATPIGRWTAFREDHAGLIAKGALVLSSPTASEVYALIAGGAIDGLSIGFRTVRAAASKPVKRRRILEAALWEVSIVTFPMAERARITRVGPPIADPASPVRAPAPLLQAPLQPPLQPSADRRARARQAFNASSLNACHFAGVLRGAAAILSV